jgi:hypothetical protein
MGGNFPVLRLAELLEASDVEPGNTAQTRSGEVREGLRLKGSPKTADNVSAEPCPLGSCGGERI